MTIAYTEPSTLVIGQRGLSIYALLDFQPLDQAKLAFSAEAWSILKSHRDTVAL